MRTTVAEGKVTTTITVSSDPAVMGGAWCIDGTRIPVDIPFRVIDRVSIHPEDLTYYYPSLEGKVTFEEADRYVSVFSGPPSTHAWVRRVRRQVLGRADRG
jgi:uncharacterized protein (DUF433 family)